MHLFHELGLLPYILLLPPDLSEIEISENKIRNGIQNIRENYHAYGVATSLILYLFSLSSTETENAFRLLNFAALSAFGDNVLLKDYGKKKKLIPLNQYVFQGLKMRVKDLETILKIQKASSSVKSLLEILISKNTEDFVLSDKERIPIEVYGLSRLELGMIIRKIGTNFSESLKLATATMIVDEMFDNFGGSANVLDEIEKNIFLEKERNSSTFCFQSLSDDERNRGKQSLLTDRINKITLSGSKIAEAVEIMQLSQIHKEAQLLNGRDLKEVCYIHFTITQNLPKY